ncbi:MAG TPA: FecR domain-containing protein, partial [Polyangia bacterium]
LSAMIRRGAAQPEDAVLSSALNQLSAAEDQAPRTESAESAAGFAAIAGQVGRIAAARRRRRALREIWIGLGGWRILAGASAMVLVLGVSAWKVWPGASVLKSFLRTGSQPPLLVETRARLKSVGQEPLRATLADGASVEVLGSIEVDQSDANNVQVRLLDGEGQILVSVPHLLAGASLKISGAHADAIVHGTRFRVEDLGGGGTSVQVFEGLVEVVPRGGNRPPVFLAAGSALQVPSLESHLRTLADRIDSAAQTNDCRSVESTVAEAIATARPTDDTSAALYFRAACAARAGDARSAIRDFEQAARVARDPTRADNALARAAELRQAADPAAAKAAWRAYLARFPQGLHRGMAERFQSDRRVR